MSLEQSSQAMVGAVLSSRYRLVRLLGEGGMGAVFEAHDLQAQGRYAIKVLHPEYTSEEQIRSRFFAEASTTSRLSHPNIARCFAYGEAEDRSPYIIMELLDGAPLTAYTKPGLAYEPQHAVPIVRAVLAALGEAHRMGVIHRDIKPDNVFLVRNPAGPPLVKVLDFGLAKVIEAVGAQRKTRTGMMLGTPGYMSPEQIQSSKTVDARCDLWAVGVILYELLTGREAFPAASEMAKLTLIATGEPSPVDLGRPHLAPWRPFFATALARDVERRFRSAGEMVTALGQTAELAARGPSGPPGPSVHTDMSPELPRGLSQHAPPPHIQVVAPTPLPGSRPLAPQPDSTLKAGDLPVLPSPGVRAPWWVVAGVGLICLALGFAAGYFVR